MQVLNKKRKTSLEDFLIGTVFALVCIAVQHSSQIIGLPAQISTKFIRSESALGSTWMANIQQLSPGDYYISVGRPRGACSLSIDGKIINSTLSELPGLRSGLLLGGGFRVDTIGHLKNMIIFCNSQEGFGPDLTHEPVIAKYFPGVILQLWRAATELLLGVISSLLIVLSALTLRNRATVLASNHSIESPFESWRYLLFGFATFFYACSLAYYTRLFLSGMPATILHILLRNVFALSGLILFTSLEKKYNKLIGGQFVLLLIAGGWSYISPSNLVLFYQWEYFYIPFSSAVVTYFMFRKEPKSKSEIVIRRVLLAWTLVQTMDWVQLWTGFGAYTAPSVICLLSVSALYLRNLEREKAISIESAVSRILSTIESNIPIDSVLKEVALITMKETKYGRVSSYVDGFCIGATESPGKAFFRVSEVGYKKETIKDVVINFSDGRGPIMAEALKKQKPVLRTGTTDGAWFLVIPLGLHACINLSDDRPKSDFLAYESFEIIERISLSLLSLERRLIDLGFQQGAALQKLRSKRGDGRWEEEFGAIFVDLNDYSQLADTFGEAFTRFVSDIYIPAFVKAVSKNSVSEHVAGDEIYFIVTRDLLQDGLSLREGVLDTLGLIDSFVINEGVALCTSAGFSAITASIGINVGLGTIISDSLSVRTAGKLVNHAKRLQEEAGKAGILVSFDSKLDFSSTNYVVGEEFFIQKKKQIIRALKILRRAVPVTKFGNVGT